MAEGDEGGAGGEAEVVVVAVAEEEATLPSFMVRRYPSTRRIWTFNKFIIKCSYRSNEITTIYNKTLQIWLHN